MSAAIENERYGISTKTKTVILPIGVNSDEETRELEMEIKGLFKESYREGRRIGVVLGDWGNTLNRIFHSNIEVISIYCRDKVIIDSSYSSFNGNELLLDSLDTAIRYTSLGSRLVRYWMEKVGLSEESATTRLKEMTPFAKASVLELSRVNYQK